MNYDVGVASYRLEVEREELNEVCLSFKYQHPSQDLWRDPAHADLVDLV